MRGDGSVISLTCLRFVGKTKRGYEAAKSRGAPAARRQLLSKVWNEVDADGSGTLDKDELKSVLLRMGHKEESIDIDAVMAEVDDDGSGDVDFREFTEWFLQMELDELSGLEDALAQEEILEEAALEEEAQRQLQLAEEAARAAEEERQRELQSRLQRVWTEVDKDGSGELDAGELKAVLLRMGRKDDIEDVMKQVDSDNSGDVDFAEFCAWFQKMNEAELKTLEEAMERAKEETEAAVGMGSLRFLSKLKKGQREKRKAAFLERQQATHRTGGLQETESSAFRNVKTEKQIEIARSQLSDARNVEDFHQLSAALLRARRLAYELDEHTLHAFCDSFEQELDEQSRLKVTLHNSEVIKREIVRFWDLMAFVSENLGAASKDYWKKARACVLHSQNKVTREGYTALHTRIGRAVHDVSKHGKWSRKVAIESAHGDWFDDVARFSGDAGISAWYAKVRQTFQKEARRTVTSMGWAALFGTFDADGSGSLEVNEFVDAVRSTGITEDTVTSMEIRQIFRHVDVDRSGEVDGEEFATWLLDMEEQAERDMRAGAQISGWQSVVSSFVRNCESQVSQMGWLAVFKKHDHDGNGELDQHEFVRAVRAECPNLEVGHEELEEMFGIIDGDGGGSITGDEFYKGLAMETEETNNMTFAVFSHSMLELADYWSLERSEQGYVQFLKAVFRAITERNPATIPNGASTINGHPKADIPVMREVDKFLLLKELEGLSSQALKRKAKSTGADAEAIAAATKQVDQDQALKDLIISLAVEAGPRPNYRLREVDHIEGVVNFGHFIDPYSAQLVDDCDVTSEEEDMQVIAASKPRREINRVQRQAGMIKDSRRPYPVGRIQGQVLSPRNRTLEEEAYRDSEHSRHGISYEQNGQKQRHLRARPAQLNPAALERLSQGYSSVPVQKSTRALPSPEQQRMIQKASSVGSMALPYSSDSSERWSASTDKLVPFKAFFAPEQGKWYFASPRPDGRLPVWAHLRAGTDAADCNFPTWLCRPNRALHGYLVYISKHQAALAIQRIFRGWFMRLTSQRLQEEQEYLALLTEKENAAAALIQARYRGRVQRTILALQKKNAVDIQTQVRKWIRRNRASTRAPKSGVFDEVPAAVLANLRSRYSELGEQGVVDVPALSQLLSEIGLSPHVVTGAQRMLSAGTEPSAMYSFDDACALIAAVGNARSSRDEVLTKRQRDQQAIAIRSALQTSCRLTEHEVDSYSQAREVEEKELTMLLQLLHKPAQLRSDRDLELLDRRWACGYTWFQELPSEMRREMCRYLRGGLLAATEQIYLTGEPLTALFFVARGCVNLHSGECDIDVREGHQPSRKVGPGEEFGLPSSAVNDTDNVGWLQHERRKEIAEAEKGTVLLALGIEQWAWTRAERVACERAMISRLLRSTALFANVSSEAHAALAVALQRNPLRFEEGEMLVKQGDGRAGRLCLLTSGEVKMTVAVREHVPDGGISAQETKIDVGIFNARGEVTGETALLEPYDAENKWKTEASLVAFRGTVRGFTIAAKELSRVLIGHCHPALSDLAAAAHHLATERKIMIWQRLRGTEIAASSSELATVAKHISLSQNARRGARAQQSSADSIGIRRSYAGSVLTPEQFAATILQEGVGAPSYMVGGHRRPQAVRIVSSLTGVPQTEALDLDKLTRGSSHAELSGRARTAESSSRATRLLPSSAGGAVMSARAAPHLRTPELPRLASSAQTARPSTVSAAERRRAMGFGEWSGQQFAPTRAPQVDVHTSDSRRGGSPLAGIRSVGRGFAQPPLLSRSGARKWGGYGSSESGKVSKRRGRQQKSKGFVPVPPPAARLRGVDSESVQVVARFGTCTQLAT